MKTKYIIFFLLIFLFVIFNITRFEWLEIFELKSLDIRYKIRGEKTIPSNIVIAAIDEKSINHMEFGKYKDGWPWQRRFFGKAVQNIFLDGAKVIGFDISFTSNDESNKKNDLYFASILRKYPNVVIGSYNLSKNSYEKAFDDFKKYLNTNLYYLNYSLGIKNPTYRNNLLPKTNYKFVPSIPEYSQIVPTCVFTVGNPDSDGIFRNIPLFFKEQWAEENNYGDVFLPNMDLMIFNKYIKNKKININLKTLTIEMGKETIPVDENGIFQIYFYGIGNKIFKKISFIDILNNNFPKETFKNKIVLFGYTTSSVGLYDLRPTPFNNNEAGVFIHANTIQNLINHDYLKRLNPLWRIFILIFTLILSLIMLSFKKSINKIFAFLVPIVFIIISYYSFINKIWIDTFYIFFANIVLITIESILSFISEYKERRKLKGFLSKYVPDTVVNNLIKNKSLNLGGEVTDVVVLFSDIQGFTEKSEKLNADEVLAFLNKYLTALSEVIRNDYNGTIDKFIGDAIMSIFGAPVKYGDEIERALNCAIDMKKRLKKLNEELDLPFELKNGIGIHYGNAIIGNLGAPFRMDYTAIGDTVNTASRVESLTRKTKDEILVTESIFKNAKGFEFEYRGEFSVKGKSKPLKIYALKGRL
ncbi:CHASE2 domain-containing protein [Tepiditoga spiralis]|uniref:CHASE2 domain-containing protein n=1 Tax=Tepiditoga spiralis TaxID=2108365 RepID=UPI001684B45D|nr:adenylate/guanylate cyclase domain-containing protein [Tepiditoga spiralis]